MLHYQCSDSKTILCELQNEIKVFNRYKHSPDLHFHPSKRRAASHSTQFGMSQTIYGGRKSQVTANKERGLTSLPQTSVVVLKRQF